MSRSDQKDKITMEEKFYSKKFYFSYSSLNKLLFSPRLFYKHYVLQEREEKTDLHLVEGKVIHSLLLDEANFNKNFIISPTKVPNPDNKKFLERIFQHAVDNDRLHCELSEHGDRILEILKEIDLHQSLKTDQQRLDKILIEQNINYYDYLKTREGKDIIDGETLGRCRESADILRSHNKISDLLKLKNINTGTQVLNEEPFQVELEGFPFGLKGVLDNMVIDDENKTIRINDLKTTAKTIADFQETIEYYNYWLQAAIYYYFAHNLKKDLGYKIKFTFIVIDKYQQIYPFLVSWKTMGTWIDKLRESLEQARWHYENRSYNLPYRFEKETVIL